MRRAFGPPPLPMAAAAAFWGATPVAASPDAESTAAPEERARVKTFLRDTTFDDGTVIKSNF